MVQLAGVTATPTPAAMLWSRFRFFGMAILISISNTMVHGKVIINEIMLNPTNVNVGRWFELHNTGGSTVSLDGWLLHATTNSFRSLPVEYRFASTDSIAGNGYLTIGESNFGGFVDLVWSNLPSFRRDGSQTGTNFNSILIRSKGQIGAVWEDRVDWNKVASEPSRNLPFSSITGTSLSRTSVTSPSQDPSSWCPSSSFISGTTGDKASPRKVNAYFCPPPTRAPTKAPTKKPTRAPTRKPTKKPTKAPTKKPTRAPTKKPTKAPTKKPTKAPTKKPTKAPTKKPTKAPTRKPTRAPTKAPTKTPTKAPAKAPTVAPTKAPTNKPTAAPTKTPTKTPSKAPSKKPTNLPTKEPTTASPTKKPTKAPTKAPTAVPSKKPTKFPSRVPTKNPTAAPTKNPTKSPTQRPTKGPTGSPTKKPTKGPTKDPTQAPTKAPSKAPTKSPTKKPTQAPTKAPSMPLPQLTGLDLYNANSDSKIVTLSNGTSVRLLRDTSRPALNVVATFNPSASPKVESVVYAFQENPRFNVEAKAPFALCSNDGSDIYSCGSTTLGCGTFTVTATPYTGSGGTGMAGTPIAVTFSITGCSSIRGRE